VWKSALAAGNWVPPAGISLSAAFDAAIIKMHRAETLAFKFISAAVLLYKFKDRRWS
jgi:hypothetical protein